MDILYYVIAAFAILGGLDYILGSKFGIGKDFEKGIMLLGTMMLTMVGMITLSPLIGLALKPLAELMSGGSIDPSVLPAILLANDMGGAHLSVEIASNPLLGQFNAFVVSSMMGATISFTVPYALGVVGKERQPDMLFGLLCGIVTIPIGCLVGGIIMGIQFGALILNLLPLVVLSGIIAFGLIKFPKACVKIFGVFGTVIKVIVIIGLISAIFEKLTGIKLIPFTDELSAGTDIIINACCVMAGAFPLISIIAKLLRKPLLLLGGKLGMNEVSVVGLVSTLATNATTFAVMDRMDSRGAKVNSAFAVSAAFTFADHLAFTLAFIAELGDTVMPRVLPAVIFGKLVSGICALIAAFIFIKFLDKGEKAAKKADTGDGIAADSESEELLADTVEA